MARRSPISPLNRALLGTRLVMMWERLLPALFPFVLLVLLIAVASQWGLFLAMPRLVHAGVLAVALLATVVIAVRAALRFRMPSFTELNQRLAADNGLKPERLLAMRHEDNQPRLKVGKAKAGIAVADPYALRFVALAAAMLGFLILGPVPLSRVESGFCPFAEPHSFEDMNLAER